MSNAKPCLHPWTNVVSKYISFVLAEKMRGGRYSKVGWKSKNLRGMPLKEAFVSWGRIWLVFCVDFPEDDWYWILGQGNPLSWKVLWKDIVQSDLIGPHVLRKQTRECWYIPHSLPCYFLTLFLHRFTCIIICNSQRHLLRTKDIGGPSRFNTPMLTEKQGPSTSERWREILLPGLRSQPLV